MSEPPPRALPPDIPLEAVGFLEQMAYFEPDRLHVGAEAPDVPLLHPDGTPARTSALWQARPVVLIFGSYT
jgi:hypothetical protein